MGKRLCRPKGEKIQNTRIHKKSNCSFRASFLGCSLPLPSPLAALYKLTLASLWFQSCHHFNGMSMKLRLKLCNVVTSANFIGKIGREPAAVKGSPSYSQDPSPNPVHLYRQTLHCLLLLIWFNDPLPKKREGPLWEDHAYCSPLAYYWVG